MPKHWGTATEFEHLEEPYKTIRSVVFEEGGKENPYLDCLLFNHGAYGVEDVPSDLLAPVKHITCADNMFYYSSISKVPGDVFYECPLIETFAGTFSYCPNLTQIPKNLFRRNSKAISFEACFTNSMGIQAIPKELFLSNSKAKSFRLCFDRAGDGTMTIPQKLFINNYEATDFEACFYEAQTPYTNREIYFVNENGKDAYPDSKIHMVYKPWYELNNMVDE